MKITANDHEVNFELIGTGKPMVLLHSLGTNGELWSNQARDLAAEFQSVCIDLRGHGKSEVSKVPVTIELLAQDVIAVIDHLKLSTFTLVGISLGGMVAQIVAAELGERVDRLILLDTSLAPASRPMWSDRAGTVRERGLSSIASDVVARWHAGGDNMSPETSTAYATMLATSDEGYAAGCDALAVADSMSAATTITVPTTVIVGEFDTATPPALAKALADAISDAELKVLKGGAHLPMLDVPALVTAVLRGHD